MLSEIVLMVYFVRKQLIRKEASHFCA